MRHPQFIKSATQKGQYPDSNLPRIAFVGRSNVGKSSLINCLVRRKGLARISSTPGRTQVLNFYRVGEHWIFVDLPGYGFARVPARVQARWAPMIEEFLTDNDGPSLIVSIVDARHEPTRLDVSMIQWLRSYQIPFQVVATKVDKVSKSKRQHHLNRIHQSLEIEDAIPFSAVTGEGRRELWRIIRERSS